MQCIEAAHQHRVNMPPNAAEHSGVRAGSSASSSTRGCLAHSSTASQATKTPSHLKRSESESKESATTEMAHPYLSELKTCLTSPTLGPSLGSHPHPQRRGRRAPERLASQGELALALHESEGEGAELEAVRVEVEPEGGVACKVKARQRDVRPGAHVEGAAWWASKNTGTKFIIHVDLDREF